MKAILLLALFATAVLAADITIQKDVWSGMTSDENNFVVSSGIIPNDQKDRGIMFYVENQGSPAPVNIEFKFDGNGHDTGLADYAEYFTSVDSNNVAVVAIPGTYWAKSYGGSMSAAYALTFNVTCSKSHRVYFTWTTPIASTGHLRMNISEEPIWNTYEIPVAIDMPMAKDSAVVWGFKMDEQLDHYYLRANIELATANVGKYGDAYMINPNFWSITSHEVFTSKDVSVRTCVSGSSCELVNGATYFIKLVTKATTDASTQFYVNFDALNGAASVTISAVLMLAMIALALF